MFTPATVKLRKDLRQAISDTFPTDSAVGIFDKIRQKSKLYIEMNDLETYCEKVLCPAAALEILFAPYGVKDLFINKLQWTAFMDDDFPVWTDGPSPASLTDRQFFILSKFITHLRTKFGGTVTQRWQAVLARNPPNTLNTELKLSAMCQLFAHTTLPFASSEFVDALFAFFGEKIDGINFAQFGNFLRAFP
jgi:hypothetical protein